MSALASARLAGARLGNLAGVLGDSLAAWAARTEGQPCPEARRAASTAVDAIDAMLAELHAARRQLVTEVRASDDANARRADELLARCRAATGGDHPGGRPVGGGTVTGRPELRLIRSCDIPPAPWWSHRLWLIREAAGTVRYRFMLAFVAMTASVATREQAWAEGFAVALGNRSARTRLQYLDEWRQGNETAYELRYLRRDRSMKAVCCPFRLPRVMPAVDQPEPAVPELASGWLSLVPAGRLAVAQGRHAGARRARSGHPQTPGRHARPGWRELVSRWFRQWHPAGAHAARSRPLSAAA